MLRPLKYVLLGCCIAVLQSTRVTAGQTIVVAADCDVTAQIVGEWRDALATRDRKQLSDVVIEVGRQRKPGAAVSHLVECWMSRAHWTESVPSDQYTWNDDGIHITYLAGQVRILLVVPPHGSQAAMTLQEIGKGMQLVREGDAPNDVPFDSACYLAWKNHPDWVKRTLVQECMLIDSASEFFRAFRRDFAPCKDRDNLVKTLNSRPRQVGFVAYGPESDLDRKPELRCVPIARRVGWSPIRPRLEPIIQLDYPLATCLLIRRRTTDTVSANFCEFAVSEAGAKIAEKYGLVTPWRHTWYEANRRLNDVQAGRGLPISVSAQAGREKLMKDLSIEFVKAKDAVQPRDDNSEVLSAVASMALHAKEAIDKSQEALADIERLRSRKSLPLQDAFPSAEAAFLLGAPSLAIAIAERAVREYPTEKVPGVRFSVGIVGNLWIGTFARYGGDVTRAEAAYREVLSQLKTRSDVELPSMLASICYLYLAEIENHVRNRPEKAAALLNELRRLPSPKEKQAAGIHTVYKQWGEHMTTSLNVSRAGNLAASERAQPPYGDPTFLPTLHAALVGLGDLGDLNSLLGAARSRSNTDFYQCSLEKATGCKVSPIDIALAQLLLGNFHERKGNLATARRYYEELFEGDSFFAPDGGLALARCWQKESKTKEATAIIQEVARRFPAFKDYAATLLQGWSTKPKNE